MTLPNPDSGQVREFDTAVCSTCGEPSSFVDNRPGANDVGYCAVCLPDSLQQAAASGQLQVHEGVDVPELSEDAQLDQDAAAAQAKVDRAAKRR